MTKYAIRDVDCDGQPAIQLQARHKPSGQVVHMLDFCIPDRDYAVKRITRSAMDSGLVPEDVSGTDWCDPHPDVWRLDTFFGHLAVKKSNNAMLLYVYALSPSHVDILGVHSRTLMDSTKARLLANHLLKCADEMDAR